MSNKDSNYTPAGTRLSRAIVCSYDTGYEHSLEHYTAVRRMVEDAELGRVAVSGMYRDGSTVNHTVNALCDAGFRNTDISVLLPESEGTKDIACGKHTDTPEKGTAPGATSGGGVNGSLAWLARIGPVATASVGQFSAIGPIVAALATAGTGGICDGLVDALFGMGIQECEARRYEGRVKEGGILLSVYSDNSDWTRKAKDILERTGADDVSSTGEGKVDFSDTDKPMLRAS